MTKQRKHLFFLGLAFFLFFASVCSSLAAGQECATGNKNGVSIKATCQVSSWGGCPSGYIHTSRAGVAVSFTGPASGGCGKEVCCFSNEDLNSTTECGKEGGRCRPINTESGSTCDDSEDYFGPAGCGFGEGCCVPKKTQPSSATTTPPSSSTASPADSSSSKADNTSSNQLVPCDTNCTLCHIVIGFKRIFDFFIKLLFIATMLAVTVSGVFYMVSTGNKGLIDAAKKGLTYSLMAFVVGMGSWIIINTIMVGFGFQHPYGGRWWEFTCDTTPAQGPASTGSGSPNWSAGKQNTGTGDGTCGGVKVRDSHNCNKTSKQLDDVMSCIQGKVANNNNNNGNNIARNVLRKIVFAQKAYAVGNIIFDTGFDFKGRTSKNSCHYGGQECQGQVNAVDLFGDLETAKNAAIECGADSVIYQNTAYFGGKTKPYSKNDHYDHVHISVNNSACRCDYLR